MISGLADHILQSTVFAAAAALLTLLLRNNHARTRYRIWLAASVKFLLPFSVLIGIGHRLSGLMAPAAAPSPRISLVIQQVSQPFTSLGAYPPVTRDFVPHAAAVMAAVSWKPLALPSLWILGLCGVLIFWLLRWRRIATVMRSARWPEEGREWEALQRLRNTAGIEARVRLAIAGRIEPSVVGIFRPVLLLPEGAADHLSDSELDAILSHELCHIRRRDNLTAALHMLVEAIFWFHPISWWIGRRLVEERENACDEEVLRMGSAPEVYAESILKICRLCLESRLACAAGVSGADLRKRIEAIMTRIPFLTGLSPFGKAAIASFGALALIAPVAIGLLGARLLPAQVPAPKAQPAPAVLPAAGPPNASLPEFTSADVHVSAPTTGRTNAQLSTSRGHLELKTATLRDLIRYAYTVNEENVVGGPIWVAEDRFDVVTNAPRDATQESQQFMLRALLRDRFGLVIHHEKRPLPAFSMTVAKRGVQMKKSSGSGPAQCVTPANENVYTAFSCRQMTMSELAANLVGWGGADFWLTPVVDETKLAGTWDFTLRWTPRPETAATRAAGHEVIPILDALDRQLGLKLDLTKRPLDAIVIDRANEKPTANAPGLTAPLPAMPAKFEVATVKPTDPSSSGSRLMSDPGGRVRVLGYTVKQLIAYAWNVTPGRVAGGPEFVESDRFDITAKVFGDDGPSASLTVDEDSLRVMMRALLAERFKLAVHNEDRPEPAYVLLAGNPKMKTADPANRSDCQNIPTPKPGPRPRMMTCQNTTMAQFAQQLMRFVPGYLMGTPVVDETALTSAYDFELNFSPAQMVRNNPDNSDPNGAISVFDAIGKELGLKLDLQKRPIPVVVIDHVEQKPIGN